MKNGEKKIKWNKYKNVYKKTTNFGKGITKYVKKVREIIRKDWDVLSLRISEF
jgi:hypothetical protein